MKGIYNPMSEIDRIITVQNSIINTIKEITGDNNDQELLYILNHARLKPILENCAINTIVYGEVTPENIKELKNTVCDVLFDKLIREL